MPYDLLLSELRGDAARPFLTYYDDSTGERVELSVTTFNNWVAKTAGLLRDGLGAVSGDRVAISLPPHWQSLAWVMAGWAVGAEVVIGKDDGAAVAVTGPDLDYADAPDVVALSLRPLGGRFTDALPDDVIDYATEVPTYPDHFAPYLPPAPDDPALTDSTGTMTFDELVRTAHERAAAVDVDRGDRLLVSTGDLATAIRDALMLPLVTSGSTVLVRSEDPANRDRRITDERVQHAL